MHIVIIVGVILVIVFLLKSSTSKKDVTEVKNIPSPAPNEPNKIKPATGKGGLGKNISPMRELERLKERRAAGDITEAEYTKLKKRVTE